MAAPAAPTGLKVTAGFGCAQLQWKAPVSGPGVPQVSQYVVTTVSLGPAGAGAKIWDGNVRPGSAAWSYLAPAPTTGWALETVYPAGSALLVAGNAWVSLLGLTSGAVQPAGLSALNPAIGTVVTDSGGSWLFVPAWTGAWPVTANVDVCLSNGAVYLCTVTGTTFAPVVIALVPWGTGYKPPVVLTVGRLDNNQAYSLSVVALNQGSIGPTGTGSGILDGNARWSYQNGPVSALPGWQADHAFGKATIYVASNTWISLKSDFVSGDTIPPGLSAPNPPPGTTVLDGTDRWLIVPLWQSDWDVSSTSSPPSLFVNVSNFYLCSQSGQTSDSAASPSSASVTATPADLGDGLFNFLSFLTGELSYDFIADLGLNPPTMWIGGQYLTNRDDGQRIVFVPRGGAIVGGELLGDYDDFPTPRQIWDSIEEVEAHIWGLELPDSDPMRDTILSLAQARSIGSHLLATIHRIGIGSNLPGPFMYPTGRDKTTRGAAVIVKFKILVPVTRYAPPPGGTGVITEFSPLTQAIED